MRTLRFIALASIVAALLILPAANRTVHSVVQTQTQQADQANVAKTTDSTYTSFSFKELCTTNTSSRGFTVQTSFLHDKSFRPASLPTRRSIQQMKGSNHG